MFCDSGAVVGAVGLAFTAVAATAVLVGSGVFLLGSTGLDLGAGLGSSATGLLLAHDTGLAGADFLFAFSFLPLLLLLLTMFCWMLLLLVFAMLFALVVAVEVLLDTLLPFSLARLDFWPFSFLFRCDAAFR